MSVGFKPFSPSREATRRLASIRRSGLSKLRLHAWRGSTQVPRYYASRTLVKRSLLSIARSMVIEVSPKQVCSRSNAPPDERRPTPVSGPWEAMRHGEEELLPTRRLGLDQPGLEHEVGEHHGRV